jgi:hypothetical protein
VQKVRDKIIFAFDFFMKRCGGQAISEGEICIGIVTVKDESGCLLIKHRVSKSLGRGIVGSAGMDFVVTLVFNQKERSIITSID